MYWNILPYHTLLYPHHTNLGHTKQIIFLTYPPCSSKNTFNHPSHSNLFCAETLQLAGKLELATRSASVHLCMGWKPAKTNMLPIFGCYSGCYIVAWTRYVRVLVQVPWTKEQGSGFIPILYHNVKCKLGPWTYNPRDLGGGVVIESNHPGHLGGVDGSQTNPGLRVPEKKPGKRMQLIWRQKKWGNKHLRNRQSQKETRLPTMHFQVQAVGFREGNGLTVIWYFMFPSKGWYKIITKPGSFRGSYYAVHPTFGTPNWIWRPRIEPVNSVVFWAKKRGCSCWCTKCGSFSFRMEEPLKERWSN